jgi:hypothetical protein
MTRTKACKRTILHHTFSAFDALCAAFPGLAVPVASTLVIQGHGACGMAGTIYCRLGGLDWGFGRLLGCGLVCFCAR